MTFEELEAMASQCEAAGLKDAGQIIRSMAGSNTALMDNLEDTSVLKDSYKAKWKNTSTAVNNLRARLAMSEEHKASALVKASEAVTTERYRIAVLAGSDGFWNRVWDALVLLKLTEDQTMHHLNTGFTAQERHTLFTVIADVLIGDPDFDEVGEDHEADGSGDDPETPPASEPTVRTITVNGVELEWGKPTISFDDLKGLTEIADHIVTYNHPDTGQGRMLQDENVPVAEGLSVTTVPISVDGDDDEIQELPPVESERDPDA